MHGRRTDIEDTKEQIKVELMGTLDDKKTNYTNGDVIAAVKKITEKEVAENTSSVKSIKGNDVDISDLWVSEDIHFTINGVSLTAIKGDTWINWINNIDNKKQINGLTNEADEAIVKNFFDVLFDMLDNGLVLYETGEAYFNLSIDVYYLGHSIPVSSNLELWGNTIEENGSYYVGY